MWLKTENNYFNISLLSTKLNKQQRYYIINKLQILSFRILVRYSLKISFFALGGIHKPCEQIFSYFWPPPFHSSHFIPWFSEIFDPSSPFSGYVVCECPLWTNTSKNSFILMQSQFKVWSLYFWLWLDILFFLFRYCRRYCLHFFCKCLKKSVSNHKYCSIISLIFFVNRKSNTKYVRFNFQH